MCVRKLWCWARATFIHRKHGPATLGEVDALEGWTVAVTAGRRASEQATMLERRGAAVVRAPVVEMVALGPEAGLRRATAALIRRPPRVLVVSTGIGMRGWFASAWAWGIGEQLGHALADVEILARGPKAAAAVVGEGLTVAWTAPSETLDEVGAHLAGRELSGCRVAVQLAGVAAPWLSLTLRSRGAVVVELPVYQCVVPDPARPAQRLIEAIATGAVDAITFTSALAVVNLMALAGAEAPMLAGRMGEGSLVVACVGPVTASAARRAGAVDPVVAAPYRLGSMVRALADRFAERAFCLELGGFETRWQGDVLAVGGVEQRLTRLDRALLGALLGSPGRVVPKERLAKLAWPPTVDDHTVEVAVNRLRAKLGGAAAALQTVHRRGYRIVAKVA